MDPSIGTLLTASAAGLTQALPRQTMREMIAGKIAALIVSGVLDLGDELPGERELAAALSVSRETIRGAIQSLAARGIVEVTHGSRTRVAKRDTGDIAVGLPGRMGVNAYALDEVHAARVLVERQVVGDAARLIDDPVLDVLRRSIVAQLACLDDPVPFLICDREFHAAIYRACGNALLSDIAIDLYTYLLDHRRRVMSRPGRIAASIADHRAILDALAAHDPTAAVAAFARHEDRIHASTRASLAQGGDIQSATEPDQKGEPA